jgi:hypothetical protein
MIEIICIYKEERYSVRDNGVVLKHSHSGENPRPTQQPMDFWQTEFEDHLLEIASVRIHRLIATVFRGEPPTKVISENHTPA